MTSILLASLLETKSESLLEVWYKQTVTCIFSFVQWVIIEQGCYSYSMVVVPLYDTLGTEAISYIVNKGRILSATEGMMAKL